MRTGVQVYRLEKHDAGRNEFKHYTGFVSADGHAVFGYSRIGAAYQWLRKPRSASGAAIVAKKLNEKRREGYEDVWAGDITVPAAYLEDASYASILQACVERARLEGASDFGTGVAAERTSPLAGLIEQARGVVSKVAADPDSGVREYGALVDAVDAAKTDLDIATNYIDTLRLMLAGAGKGA